MFGGIKVINGILKGTTPQILDQENKSIAILEKIIIGGINQCICIRGKNIENPILLFLHGGPGDSMLPVMTGINKDLEDDFIVVNWDQRGAGKFLGDCHCITSCTTISETLLCLYWNWTNSSYEKE